MRHSLNHSTPHRWAELCSNYRVGCIRKWLCYRCSHIGEALSSSLNSLSTNLVKQGTEVELYGTLPLSLSLPNNDLLQVLSRNASMSTMQEEHNNDAFRPISTLIQFLNVPRFWYLQGCVEQWFLFVFSETTSEFCGQGIYLTNEWNQCGIYIAFCLECLWLPQTGINLRHATLGGSAIGGESMVVAAAVLVVAMVWWRWGVIKPQPSGRKWVWKWKWGKRRVLQTHQLCWVEMFAVWFTATCDVVSCKRSVVEQVNCLCAEWVVKPHALRLGQNLWPIMYTLYFVVTFHSPYCPSWSNCE